MVGYVHTSPSQVQIICICICSDASLSKEDIRDSGEITALDSLEQPPELPWIPLQEKHMAKL